MAMGEASSAGLRVSANGQGGGSPGWEPGSPQLDAGGGGISISDSQGSTAGADDHEEVLVEYKWGWPSWPPEGGRARASLQNPSDSSTGGRQPKPPSAEGLSRGGGYGVGAGRKARFAAASSSWMRRRSAWS